MSKLFHPHDNHMSATSDEWQDLANAVIIQAAQDYRRAAKRLKKHPDSVTVQGEISELEQFFLSGWFCTLSDADGEQILNRLRKEAGL